MNFVCNTGASVTSLKRHVLIMIHYIFETETDQQQQQKSNNAQLRYQKKEISKNCIDLFLNTHDK